MAHSVHEGYDFSLSYHGKKTQYAYLRLEILTMIGREADIGSGGVPSGSESGFHRLDKMSFSLTEVPKYRKLANGRVVLASKSPRRKQILTEQLGLDVSVFPSGFPEDLDKSTHTAFEYVVNTAIQKAVDVYKAEIDSDKPPSLVLGADTIVLCDDVVMEKPRDIGHNIKMLKQLRDCRTPHQVFTAVACIIPFDKPVSPGYAMETHLEETEVHFDRNITDEMINAYANSKEGSDAAGGYKIQNRGAMFVSKINGDYYNVMGMPVHGTMTAIDKTLKTARDVDDDSEDDDHSDDEIE